MNASAASSSAASFAAAINDSKDNRREQVSDVFYDMTNKDDDDDYVSNNENKETDADMFFWVAQNRLNKKIGTDAMEDCQFRSLFGARQDIVEMVWGMLGKGGLHPEKSEPKHLLWALYFMKVYPRESPKCFTVGGSKGAIDP
jgi:hypothetical protein